MTVKDVNGTMSFPYEDILHLPYPRPSKRAKMSMVERAAQFAPFAALTGYDSAIAETARLTGQKVELDESEKLKLGETLCFLSENPCRQVSVTHFVADSRKAGGSYVLTTAHVKKVDPYSKKLILTDGQSISLDDIIELNCE